MVAGTGLLRHCFRVWLPRHCFRAALPKHGCRNGFAETLFPDRVKLRKPLDWDRVAILSGWLSLLHQLKSRRYNIWNGVWLRPNQWLARTGETWTCQHAYKLRKAGIKCVLTACFSAVRTRRCFVSSWYIVVYGNILCLHCQISSSENTLWIGLRSRQLRLAVPQSKISRKPPALANTPASASQQATQLSPRAAPPAECRRTFAERPLCLLCARLQKNANQ